MRPLDLIDFFKFGPSALGHTNNGICPFQALTHARTHSCEPLTTISINCSVVPAKTLQRFAREAKAAGKGSFAFAWVLDQGEAERAR